MYRERPVAGSASAGIGFARVGYREGRHETMGEGAHHKPPREPCDTIYPSASCDRRTEEAGNARWLCVLRIFGGTCLAAVLGCPHFVFSWLLTRFCICSMGTRWCISIILLSGSTVDQLEGRQYERHRWLYADAVGPAPDGAAEPHCSGV